jgi:glycosyltransferase involved in cell wall biosynthesis
MKRIVIDARELRTSTGRYIERLLNQLQQVDNDLSHRYIVLLKPEDMEGWKPTSKRFTKVACRYKEFGFGEQLGMAWQLYQLRPHLVHFGMVQQPLLYFGHVVTTIHDLTTLRFRNPAKNRVVFRFKQWVYSWVITLAGRKSKFLITPSEYTKDDVAKYAHLNSRKIFVTYEAADPIPEQPEEIAELAGKRFIMYVGRPLPHKNLGRLLEAFAILQQSQPDLMLVLAGKKDVLYKRHEKRTQRKGIKNVHFTDFVSEGELRWLYEHCAAYVFPSLSEGFGLPGLEAMVHGAPVVSSNATCLPEIYGPAAEYFDPRSVEDMAAKIKRVLLNEKRRKELIVAGKKQANKYSWRKTAEQTLAVYNQVLK